jgi:hypothetical protein
MKGNQGVGLLKISSVVVARLGQEGILEVLSGAVTPTKHDVNA